MDHGPLEIDFWNLCHKKTFLFSSSFYKINLIMYSISAHLTGRLSYQVVRFIFPSWFRYIFPALFVDDSLSELYPAKSFWENFLKRASNGLLLIGFMYFLVSVPLPLALDEDGHIPPYWGPAPRPPSGICLSAVRRDGAHSQWVATTSRNQAPQQQQQRHQRPGRELAKPLNL